MRRRRRIFNGINVRLDPVRSAGIGINIRRRNSHRMNVLFNLASLLAQLFKLLFPVLANWVHDEISGELLNGLQVF